MYQTCKNAKYKEEIQVEFYFEANEEREGHGD